MPFKIPKGLPSQELHEMEFLTLSSFSKTSTFGVLRENHFCIFCQSQYSLQGQNPPPNPNPACNEQKAWMWICQQDLTLKYFLPEAPKNLNTPLHTTQDPEEVHL